MKESLLTDVRDWFTDEFCKSQLMDQMELTVEDSPYHREANVKVHTIMVFDAYMEGVQRVIDNNHTPASSQDIHNFILGAFAAAFHDVGKPLAEITKHSEALGEYRAYTNHEGVSGRLWEDYATTHWKMLTSCFGLTPMDIYTVGWMIQNHLPYAVKKHNKLNAIARTLSKLQIMDAFEILLHADTAGRVSDPGMKRVSEISQWINTMFERIQQLPIIDVEKSRLMVMMIAPPGAGKTTYVNEQYPDAGVYSYDILRHEWYNPEDYRDAWYQSTQDYNFFIKAHKVFTQMTDDVVVNDNVNLTMKSRNQCLAYCRQHGIRTKAVLVPSPVSVNIARQLTRTDKTVPEEPVRIKYFSLRYPSYGDFDEIEVYDGNLPK